MKDGFKVWDSDTHVEPSAEVIDRYLDPGFRNRLPGICIGRGSDRAQIRIGDAVLEGIVRDGVVRTFGEFNQGISNAYFRPLKGAEIYLYASANTNHYRRQVRRIDLHIPLMK